jgi:hypothetical protein
MEEKSRGRGYVFRDLTNCQIVNLVLNSNVDGSSVVASVMDLLKFSRKQL